MVDNIAKEAKTVITLFWHLASAKDKSTVNKKGVNVAKVLRHTNLKELKNKKKTGRIQH